MAAGEVHGFLGPNGAGKTTDIRVLLGLLRADSGRSRLLGGDPWRDATELHGRLAYAPGDVPAGGLGRAPRGPAGGDRVELRRAVSHRAGAGGLSPPESAPTPPWVARVRPFAGERWWLLVLFAATAGLLAAAAFALSTRRDIAAGVLPPRLGAAAAPGRPVRPGLAAAPRRPAGLDGRLRAGRGGVRRYRPEHRLGARLQPGVIDILRRLGGGGQDLVDTFLAAELGILALLASGHAVSAALRLRSKETDQRAEPVLATGVGRVRYAASHLLFALLGPAAAPLAAGTAAGLVHGALVGDVPGRLGVLVAGALVQLPAVCVLTGIALALFGLLPRLTVPAWAALVAFVLFGQFGALLRLDRWLLDLSPFIHLPPAR